MDMTHRHDVPAKQCDDCFITQHKVAAYCLQQPRPLYIFLFHSFSLPRCLFLSFRFLPFSSLLSVLI